MALLARGNRTAPLAREESVRAALDWFTRERAWINERQLELSRVPAPTFFEQKRAEWMLAELRGYGAEARLDKCGNVIAFPWGDDGGPLIAVTAHLDTVLAPRQPEDIRIGTDGRFLGPGIADNGAGLAALLALAKLLTQTDADARTAAPVLIANVGEEGEGNLSGMRYLCSRQSRLSGRIQAFLVLDGPATEHITSQALGSRRFEIVFTGPGGHSWGDFGIGNPVHALGRVIAAFSEQAVNGGTRPKASFNFGWIEGGTSINAIPPEARAKVDLRSEDAARLDDLATLLESTVARALEAENQRAAAALSGSLKANAYRLSARVREIGSRPAGKLDDAAPLLASLRDVDEYLGIRSYFDCASTDANVPLALGIDAVSIGAGGTGGGAHTPGEWYLPEGRETALRRVFLTLWHLLREPNLRRKP